MSDVAARSGNRMRGLFPIWLAKPKDSIGTRLDGSRGLGKGFDFLRVVLATLVVYVHTYEVTGFQDMEGATVKFMKYWVLAVFFGLSGFLITGSALRLRLRDFIINRGIRIVPALFVDVVFSVAVIGILFTTLPVREYLADSRIYFYLLNTVGDIHYFLPGVFGTHPETKVNPSLWTVPFEIGCYVIMAFLIISKSLKHPLVVIVCSLAAMIAALAADHYELVTYGDVTLTTPWQIAVTRGGRLVVCFLLGISAFQLRYWLPYDWRPFAVGFLWCLFLNFDLHTGSLLHRDSVLNIVAAPVLIYMMTFLGVSEIPPLPLFRHGDYSYGIYLYGFPLQQIAYALLPNARSPLLQFAIVIPFIIIFAMFSWHAIEKPLLKVRKKFSFVARQRIAESAPDSELAGAENNKPLPVGSGSV